ncbi:MAG: NAD(P)-binding domain-containing protein [Streptosporangiales bacterium]|jgi:hypothetical protein|nr:NAD(P)-binding domain-containing protein [Streptosporangiales bacterium]
MPDGRFTHSKVGILGSGDVGRSLAKGFLRGGHDVMIGTRGAASASLRDWADGDGKGVATGTFEETAAHGDLLALALLGDIAEDVLARVGPGAFGGKVVLDAMNPLDFSGGFPPKLSLSGDDSLGERVQRAVPGARVVKAFNTIGYQCFVDPRFSGGVPTMLIAGNDDGAKAVAADVLADFGWPDTVDIGGIEGSRELEALCITWLKIVAVRGGSVDHGFKLLAG